MGVERVDYCSDEEYQQALQWEEEQYRQWEEERKEEEDLAELWFNIENFCFRCKYWNGNKEKPKCQTIKEYCNYNHVKCNFKEKT